MVGLDYLRLMLLVWVLYTFSFLVTAARIVTRFLRHKTFFVEDYLILFGIACLTALSIVITLMTPKFVATGHLLTQAITNPAIMAQPESLATLNDNSTALKFMFSQMFLFFTTLFAAKCSLLFFFRRLIIGLPKYLKFWMATLIIIILLYIGCMLSNVLTCTPLNKYWSSTGCSSLDDRRRSDRSIRFATGADIASDLLVMILPLNLLRKLQLNGPQRAGLAAVFGIGFIIIAFAIARLSEVTRATTNASADITSLANAPMTLSAWSHVEASVAVVVASLPTFRFLLSPVARRKYYASSEPKRISNHAPSARTIGSGSQRKPKQSTTGTTTLGSLDAEVESTDEVRPYSKHEMGNGITKQIGFGVSEHIVQPNARRRRDDENETYLDEYRNRNRLYPSHMAVYGDKDAAPP